jgi:hypothetical protein
VGKEHAPRQPRFDLGGHLYRITGLDLTQIDSIDVQIEQTVISEVRLDMSRWKTEKALCVVALACVRTIVSAEVSVEAWHRTSGPRTTTSKNEKGLYSWSTFSIR